MLYRGLYICFIYIVPVIFTFYWFIFYISVIVSQLVWFHFRHTTVVCHKEYDDDDDDDELTLCEFWEIINWY